MHLSDVVDVIKVWVLNGGAFAVINLTAINDVLSIILSVAAIISTAIIIRKNLKKK